jgi:hypothetical protein
VAHEVVELFGKSAGKQLGVLTEAAIAKMPEPVQRWLDYAQVIGRQRPLIVRLKQEGLFRQAAGQDWMPFEAEEYYTTDPPGFLWSATMKKGPLLSVTGRDRYYEGKGSIDFRLLSLIPVARAEGAKIDQGALLRYLNETMWFPAAAVSPWITWEGIDAHSARATMSFQGLTASAVFSFDDEGRLITMVAQRYMGSELETWCTPISEYGEFNGVRVPVAGEGVWKLRDGDFTYIKLRVTEIDYCNPPGY